MLISGAVAGCRFVGSVPSSPGSAPLPVGTLTLDLRYRLENDSIDYSPHAAGCDRTTIRGTVRDAGGNPASGLMVRVWADDPMQATALFTDGGGAYTLDVADALSSAVYHLQLFDAAGLTLLSDVIVAEAIPDCNLNVMTVNFVASE
jgi:hypothetical protein